MLEPLTEDNSESEKPKKLSNAEKAELRQEWVDERALELLQASELTLEEIAQRLGYSSVPNFARAFRRWRGESPARYRRAPR